MLGGRLSSRVTQITEIQGFNAEGQIDYADIFRFKYTGMDDDGRIQGDFKALSKEPHFIEKVEYYNLQNELKKALGG